MIVTMISDIQLAVFANVLGVVIFLLVAIFHIIDANNSNRKEKYSRQVMHMEMKKLMAIMDNGPARSERFAQTFQKAGEDIGDPLEISTIRREDYVYHTDKGEYADLYQAGNCPTTAVHRGHQGPAAFLIMVSGLDKHGIDSDQPLKYTHVDISGFGLVPDHPTAAILPAMVHRFLYTRE